MESLTEIAVVWGPYVLVFVLVAGLEILRRRNKDNTGKDMWPLLEFSTAAVAAAEQIFGDKATGEDKYAWVENAMMIAFPNLDKVLIRTWVESAVSTMNQNKSEKAVNYFTTTMPSIGNVTIKEL